MPWKAQNFILTPGRYVGIAEQEDDGEPFDKKMKHLTTELSILFTESHRLEPFFPHKIGKKFGDSSRKVSLCSDYSSKKV